LKNNQSLECVINKDFGQLLTRANQYKKMNNYEKYLRKTRFLKKILGGIYFSSGISIQTKLEETIGGKYCVSFNSELKIKDIVDYTLDKKQLEYEMLKLFCNNNLILGINKKTNEIKVFNFKFENINNIDNPKNEEEENNNNIYHHFFKQILTENNKYNYLLFQNIINRTRIFNIKKEDINYIYYTPFP
jgi:hypothetical protein